MSIKTIVVHLSQDPDYTTQRTVAIGLARRFVSARLVGVYTTHPIAMPPGAVGRAASSAFLAARAETAREKSEENEKAFGAECAVAGVEFDWVVEDGDPTEILAEHARYADLAVVGQTPPETLEDLVLKHPPDQLALIADGPVVVVPHRGAWPEVGRRVLVAWKPSREASRAVRDAMPLLRAAESVAVLTVGTADDAHAPGKLLARHLERHGIRIELRPIAERDGYAGAVLLAQVKAWPADLVVMGAYSKSRLREVILGGATHQALRETPVPVLMSH